MLFSHKLALGGVVTSGMGILLGWLAIPMMVTHTIGKVKALAPGSESRDFWEKVPFTLDFKVYLFNVTNHREVQAKGEIPSVQEIGPFFYDETKEKADIVEYDEDDSMSFYMKNTYVFNREKSAPLTGQERVYLPHPFIMGVINTAERERPTVLGMINGAIPLLFDNPRSLFHEATAHDYLFGGLPINCTSKEFQAVAICSILKKTVKNMVPTGRANVFKYSFFGAVNGSNYPAELKIYRGMKDAQRVGEVISVDGKDSLAYWGGRPCNDIMGTDATVFPPDTKPSEPLWTYSFELCRSFMAKFVGEAEYKGVKAFKYLADFGDLTKDPSLKCYCQSEKVCTKKGALDVAPCTGAPVIATLPHFYDSDEDYLRGVRGLRPDKDAHEMVVELEPMTGTPLYAKKRVMFSVPMHKVKNVKLTENLKDHVVPFMWLEESLELNEEFMAKLDRELFLILRIVDGVRWTMVFGGIVMTVSAVGVHFKKNNSLSVTPTAAVGKDSPAAEEFVGGKKPRGMDADVGHTNFGYI